MISTKDFNKLVERIHKLERVSEQCERIIEWHVNNGGYNGRLAGHALRLLTEAIELCIATGASPVEISMAVGKQLGREVDKNPERRMTDNMLDLMAVREELADVSMCLDIVDHWSGDKPDQLYDDREAKLKINRKRKWQADEDGVLWSPKES